MNLQQLKQCMAHGIHGLVIAALAVQPALAHGADKDSEKAASELHATGSPAEIPEREKFQECWRADFTESESYTIPKDRKEFMGGMVTRGRRDVVKTSVNTSYVVCYEKDGRGALVVNGSLVPMVRPKDTIIYGDTGEIILFDSPLALYAEWVRPDQPTTELLILLDRQTQKITATKRTEHTKTRYKESAMIGTASRIAP